MSHPPLYIHFFYDPMAGWCYAGLEGLLNLSTLPNITITMSPTGVYTGAGREQMTPKTARMAHAFDKEIEKCVGRRYSSAYFQDILYNFDIPFDSLKANLALTAVNLIEPDFELLAFDWIQTARYIQAKDITQINVVLGILKEHLFTHTFEQVQHLLLDPFSYDEVYAKLTNRIAKSQRTFDKLNLTSTPAIIARTCRTQPWQVIDHEYYYQAKNRVEDKLLKPFEALLT